MDDNSNEINLIEENLDTPERRPYKRPVLRSTEAFEKLALQSCAPNDKFPQGICAET